MTTKPPQRRKTRDLVLEAAQDLFDEEGYAGFTMVEVERRVGLAVGTGSIHRHYPSKEALLQAVVERKVARGRAATQEARLAVQQVEDPIEQSMGLYKQMLDDLRPFNRVYALMLDQGDRRPELREAIRTAVRPPETPVTTEDRAVNALVVAALGGYYLFSVMQDQPFESIEEDDFLRLLAVTAQLAVTVQLADASARRRRNRSTRRKAGRVAGGSM